MIKLGFFKFIFLIFLFFNLSCKQSKSNINLQSMSHSNFPFFAQTNLNYTLYGNTSGYGILRTDGIADFGLILKSFNKKKLYQIELNDLMTTEFDKISVLGNTIEIPTNVALPQQRERYILSINLNKPNYKIHYKINEDQQLVLLHGQFPFSDVVQGFRNDQPFLKLADKFNFISYSEYSFENTNLSPELNLDLIAGQKTHSTNIQIRSPRSFPSGYTFVVVALDQKDNVYLANNLTVLSQNEIRNFKIGNSNALLFSGLIHESFADSESRSMLKHKMSFQMQNSNRWTPELLDFIENFRFSSNHLFFSLPNNKGYYELGLVYNIVEISQSGIEEIIDQNVILGAWTSSIDLNYLNSLKRPNFTYRVDLFLGAAGHTQIPRDLTELFELSEFVTRNSFML